MVLIHLLNKFDYLKLDEYTYLLPLCIGQVETAEIVDGISQLRSDSTSIDKIIINRLMDMPNYKTALDYLLENEVNEDLICEIGLNRKSRQYDKSYFKLYQALRRVFVLNDMDVNVIKSADNVPTVKTAQTNELNVFDVLKYDTVVVTKDAVKTIEEVYA